VLVFDAMKLRRAANLHVLVSVAGVWPQVLAITGLSTSNSEYLIILVGF
jgi:hypothetical protein